MMTNDDVKLDQIHADVRDDDDELTVALARLTMWADDWIRSTPQGHLSLPAFDDCAASLMDAIEATAEDYVTIYAEDADLADEQRKRVRAHLFDKPKMEVRG